MLERIGIGVCHLVELAGSTPSPWTLSVCTAGHTEAGYGPRILQLGDLVNDDGGLSTLTFTLKQTGPYIWTFDGSTRNTSTMSKVLQTAILNDCTATVKLRAIDPVTGTREDTTLIVGEIVDFTPAPDGVTFVVEQRAQVRQREMPQNEIKRQGCWGFNDEEIPEETIGEYVPIFVGKLLPHAPFEYPSSDYNARDPNGYRYLAGLHPVVVPAVEIQRENTTQRFAYQEKVIGGGLSIPISGSTSKPLAFRYRDAAKGYALIPELGVNAVFSTAPLDGAAYNVQVQRDPWEMVPLVPEKIGSNTDITDPKNLLDRSSATYAKLGPAGDVFLDIPLPGDLGYVALNSTFDGTGTYDRSGASAPCGLSVWLAIVAPAHEPAGTGTVELSVVFPLSTTKLFNVSATASVPSAGSAMTILPLFLPFNSQTDGSISDPNDGWGGTKWHRCDFTNSIDATTTAESDHPVYDAASATVIAPCRIRIRRASGTGKAYLASVAFVVGCRPNAQSFVAERFRTRNRRVVKLRDNPSAPNGANYGWADSDYFWMPGNLQPSIATVGRDRSEVDYGGRRKSGIVQVPFRDLTREAPSISNVYVSTLGYNDLAGGDYTGTAAKTLNNPLHAARYFLEEHAGETLFASSGLGSWAQARTVLNHWATLAPGPAFEWNSESFVLSEQSTDSVMRMLEQEMPGGRILRGGDGTWRAHVWTFDATKWGSSLFSATALDARRLVCRPPGAGPEISMNTTDSGGVVNDCEVEYDYDPGSGRYRRLAIASADSWDDGYGGDVPSTPSTGQDPTALCAWSQLRFGGRRPARLSVPGIRNPQIAAALLASVLWRRYRPLPTLSCRLNHMAHGLQVGHIFRFSNASLTALGYTPGSAFTGSNWDSIYWRVTKADWQIGARGERTRVIVAEWNPTSIGSELGAMAGGGEFDPPV